MRLPVQVIFHDSVEPVRSLVSRLALANGYSSMQELLCFSETSLGAIDRGDPHALEIVSDWSGIPVDQLSRNRIAGRGAGGAWRLGRASMNKEMRIGKSHRYCPKCVVHDLEHGRGRTLSRPYVQTAWLSRAFSSCPEHSCRIVETAVDDLLCGDFSRFVATNLDTIQIEASRPSTSLSTELDRYVRARISGQAYNDFLDGFEAYITVDLCRYLGRFVKKHGQGVLDETPHLSEREQGFLIASKGAAQIEQAVRSAVVHSNPMVHEMKGFFSGLRSWLLRNVKKPEFASLIGLFQEIAENTLPIGPDDLFVLPSRRRRLHSVASASRDYGIFEERVYQLVVEAGLVEPTELSSTRIFFDADQGHNVLSQALATMTSSEVASALGTTIERVRAILAVELLPRTENFDGTGRVFSRIPKAEFEIFKMRLEAFPPVESDHDELLDFGIAARKCFCTIEQILGFALSGALKSVRRSRDPGSLSALRIDVDELRATTRKERRSAAEELAIPVISEGGTDAMVLNHRQAERRLKTASGTVTELVRLEYLKVIEGLNPTTKRRQNYVCAASVDAFKTVHISLAELSVRTNMFPSVIRGNLNSFGINSIYEPTGRNSRYYLRQDVENF